MTFEALFPSATPELLAALGNHLWQSTLYAAGIALLAFFLRQHRAQVRYGLWWSASIKFLVPFAALVDVGRRLPWSAPGISPSGAPLRFMPDAGGAMDTLILPFSQAPAAIVPTSASTWSTSGIVGFVLGAVWVCGCAASLLVWWKHWQASAAAAERGTPVRDGRLLAALRRLEPRDDVRTLIRLVSSREASEPGVFGILRPRLLWPEAITPRLDDRQVEAILAHELAHVRRRDNLTAAVHRLVRCLFWFHPVVWWLGARLMDERERACDEAVLQTGSEPFAYAEGLLQTCRVSVGSLQPCMAGVSGSDLKARIERIVSGRRGVRLGRWRTCALSTVGLVVLGGPVAFGLASAGPQEAAIESAAPDAQALREAAAHLRELARETGGHAQAVNEIDATRDSPGRMVPRFDVVSVRVNDSGQRIQRIAVQPGRFTATNVPLMLLVADAYDLPEYRIEGGGPRLEDRFDVEATTGAESMTPERLEAMLQALLAERFALRAHTERREMGIYDLVLVRNDGQLGPNLSATQVDCDAIRAAARAQGGLGGPPPPPPPPPPGQRAERPQCGMWIGGSGIAGGGMRIDQLAGGLSRLVRRTVVDRTGLEGMYDIDLAFAPPQVPQFGAPDGAPGAAVAVGDLPDIFTAVRQQLGLTLESNRGPVTILVIDSVEAPTPD